MEADSKDGETTIGPRIKKWLRNIGRYLGKEGVKAGVDVAKQMALKWLMQHAGARSATQSAFRLRCNEIKVVTRNGDREVWCVADVVQIALHRHGRLSD